MEAVFRPPLRRLGMAGSGGFLIVAVELASFAVVGPEVSAGPVPYVSGVG